MHLIENFLNMNKLLGDSKSQFISNDKLAIAEVKTTLVTMLTASLTFKDLQFQKPIKMVDIRLCQYLLFSHFALLLEILLPGAFQENMLV